MRAQGIEQWDETYPALFDIKWDVSRGDMYVATECRNILAAVTINEEQDPEYATGGWQYHDGRIAAVHRLCVHPHAQGMGLGKWTMLRVEDCLTHGGNRAVRLDAFVHNRAANALYRSWGTGRPGTYSFAKENFFCMKSNGCLDGNRYDVIFWLRTLCMCATV